MEHNNETCLYGAVGQCYYQKYRNLVAVSWAIGVTLILVAGGAALYTFSS